MQTLINKTKLSIIIPVYNVEKYLRRCLDSILAQTFKDFELILINDASTDSSQLIVDEYKKKDSRIISIINKENSGAGKTRNVGLSIAKGEYVTFVDSDDWIEKEMYQEMMDILIKNQVDLVECNVKTSNNNYIFIKKFKTHFGKIDTTIIEYLNYLNKQELGIMIWNKIYKIEIIKNYDIKFVENKKIFNEDLLFNLSYMHHANSLMVINKPFYNYDVRPGSITQGANTYNIHTNILAINNFIENNKDLSNFKEKFISFSSLIVPSLIYPAMSTFLDSKNSMKSVARKLKEVRKNKLTFTILKNCLQDKNSPFKDKISCIFIIFKMYYLLIFIYLIIKKIKINNIILSGIRFLNNPILIVRFQSLFLNLKYIYFKIKYHSLIIRNNTTDSLVFKEIFAKNEFNIPINQPNFIVDCGAYVGYSTFYFSKKYPKSTIVAIEPEISNFNILKENTKNLKNVSIINRAIYYKKTKLKIIDSSEGKWAFQVSENDNGDIDSITIEELLEEFKFNRIDLLKIDIEGSEKILFENSDNWINKVNCIAIELHDRYINGCSDSFFSALKKGDFIIEKSGEKVIAINKNQ